MSSIGAQPSSIGLAHPPSARRAATQSATVSTESIESIASQPPLAAAAARCAACAAPLADDQRYCLQCGERTTPISGVLLGGPPASALASGAGSQANGPGSAPPAALGPTGAAPPSLSGVRGGGEAPGRGSAVTVIAGVGVLLLAMGIGVLIGRSGASKQPAVSAVPQVISVASTPAAGAATPASESFTGDWPAGSGGYTVQLQTLPSASTQVGAVQAAKSAAEGKGAKAVGALRSDEFASLPAGNYIVYSGKYAKKAEAEKALGALRKGFPRASVLKIAGSRGASGGKGAGAGASGGGNTGVGSSPSKPAPPSAAEGLKGKSGKSYEQQSNSLPNVVSTG
jgi:hypothetical protein